LFPSDAAARSLSAARAVRGVVPVDGARGEGDSKDGEGGRGKSEDGARRRIVAGWACPLSLRERVGVRGRLQPANWRFIFDSAGAPLPLAPPHGERGLLGTHIDISDRYFRTYITL